MTIDHRRTALRPRLAVSAWRGHADVVVVSPIPDRPAPTAADLRAEVTRLGEQGVRRILTGALHHTERPPFEAVGFAEHEHLHLLRHDLVDLPAAPDPSPRLRRAWRRDLTPVLDIDGRAFDRFWALDRQGIEDAVRATPSARFRVAVDATGTVTGYAITGRAAERGYLQRLAVDPDRHRLGHGRALVSDSLRWLRRSGAALAVVNTQEHNVAALALYRAVGFVDEPLGLTVLVLDLPAPS